MIEDQIRESFVKSGIRWKIDGEKIIPNAYDIRSVIEQAKKAIKDTGGAVWVDGIVVQSDGQNESFSIYVKLGEEDANT